MSGDVISFREGQARMAAEEPRFFKEHTEVFAFLRCWCRRVSPTENIQRLFRKAEVSTMIKSAMTLERGVYLLL